jgi:hypothetical protein
MFLASIPQRGEQVAKLVGDCVGSGVVEGLGDLGTELVAEPGTEAQRPCFKALAREISLPAGVFGPVLISEFQRFAVIRASVTTTVETFEEGDRFGRWIRHRKYIHSGFEL